MSKLLCISDLHLGSPVCKTDKIIDLLASEEWEEIVINGDLLDSSHYKRYSKKHWDVLKNLRKLSKKCKVTLVEGNHDKDAGVLCEILGLDFVQQYSFNNILFIHGHQFDGFIKKNPKITLFASNIYYLIQLFDKHSKITGWIKKRSKSWLDASRIVRERAVKYALDHEYSNIVCGHVHQAEQLGGEGDFVRYWNTGTFCDSPSHYFVVDKEEKMSLNSV